MWWGDVTYVHFELHARLSSAFNDVLFEFEMSPIRIPHAYIRTFNTTYV